ncbi:MAG: glutamate--cysteine ligase [Actinomycetota bacterium]|nr:glutamate/cysteine ligase family protein [Cryptosporangiaceae bacterium]MDQ1678078.1 glutamate--cysteine ligase [Actinomycetota bacterium]
MTGMVVQETSARVAGAEDAEAYVASTCFKTGPPRLLGVELEWFVHDTRNPRTELSAGRLAAALGPHLPATLGDRPSSPLPCGSVVTVEPGGQVEISSPPAPTLTECLRITSTDLQVLAARFRAEHLALHGSGVDRYRQPHRILRHPRYAAMEAHFDRTGDAGREMMCTTASVQVSVDTGVDPAERWSLLHKLGPVLVAMFADSAVQAGQFTGWRSTRQSIWARLDPSRTRPPETTGDPREAYARFALDAELLCCRRSPDCWDAPAGTTFREWLDGAFGPPPTYDDLAYHLTTLFPPVRAQGHLEVRYLDQQSGDAWQVATAVVAALVGDAQAADLALAAAEPAEGRWEQAARCAVADPVLDRAARSVADVTGSALARLGAQPELLDTVDRFFETYTDQGRCPADDDLDARSVRDRGRK